MGNSTAIRIAEEVRKRGGRPRTVVLGQRPPTYNEKIAEEVLEKISIGRTFKSIMREHEGDKNWLPTTTIRNWIHQDPDVFGARWLAAQQAGAHCYAEETIDISDDDTANVMRSRLRVDTRKWWASKLYPKLYGDRVEHDHAGTVNVEVDVAVVRASLAETVIDVQQRLLKATR